MRAPLSLPNMRAPLPTNPSVSRRGTWPLVCVALLALLMAACGTPDRGIKDASMEELLAHPADGDAERVETAIVELTRRARRNPEPIVSAVTDVLRHWWDATVVERIYLQVASEAEAAKGDLTAVHTRMAEVIAARLAAHGYAPGAARIENDGVELRVPRAPKPREGEDAWSLGLLERLQRQGEAELLVVAERPDSTPPASAWEGDAASYDAYVAAEKQNVDRRGVRSAPPGTPGFRLVPWSGPFAGPDAWILVHTPREARDYFDRDSLRFDGGGNEATAELMLQVAVIPARRADAARWSAAHTGRQIALVVDGVAGAVSGVGSGFSDHALLPVGDARKLSDVAWFKDVMATLRTPPYLRPVKAELRPTESFLANPAPARALAEIGAPAHDELRRLLAEGGPPADAARWALLQIRRRKNTPRPKGSSLER